MRSTVLLPTGYDFLRTAGKKVSDMIKEMGIPADTTLSDVSGIGDAAARSDKSKTLHVASGRYLFTVTVESSEAVNRPKALIVAKEIVATL